ncbi:MAG: S8 family serine peptidase [candidate division WOR-3 bacterium]
MKRILLSLMVLFFVLGLANSVTSPKTASRSIPGETKGNKLENFEGPDAIPKFLDETKAQFIPAKYGDGTKIIFSNGIYFDTKFLGKDGEPDLPEELKIQYREDESGYYIVQFSGPIYEIQKKWLEENGANIHFYIPNYGFVVSVKNRTQIEAIRTNPSVNWAGIYQPAYKISKMFNRVGEEHIVTILLFMDSDIALVLDEIKAITKKTEFAIVDNGINKIIRGVINKKDLSAIAHIKGVYWIEPYIRPVVNNDYVQWIVQSGTSGVRSIWAKGIAGEGEIVHTSDTGINCNHYAHLSGSSPITTWGDYPSHNAIIAYKPGGPSDKVLFGDGQGGGSYHGTHTAGTITGDDTLTSGGSARDGVAKRSRIYFTDIGGSADTLWIFGDLNELFILPYNGNSAGGARVSSNSWGAAVAGEYTAEAQQVDQFMWAHRDFLICMSNGNEGPGTNTVGSPATAKNCASIGASDNGSTYYTYLASYSSRGPTDDGRQKPTVLAPGGYYAYVYSSTSGTNTYGGMQGTSMACPGAAGAAALARQYLREGWYPSGKKTAGNAWSYISAAMLKAILVNSADTNMRQGTNGYIPNNNLGWGRINLDSTLYFSGEARKTLLLDDTIGVLTGERKDYHFNVPSGAANLKITVVWTDYPGNPAVLKQIVNDLDLYCQIGSTFYRGNQYSNGQSVANPAGRDSLNVEECVRVNSPTAGDWLVRIEGRNVPFGPQPFALVITYTATAVAGVVSTDKPVYRANDFIIDTVRVRVEDPNYGAVGIRDTVRVVLSGKYIETQPETLKCVELAESSYIFKGEIPLLFRGATHNDGRLSVCQGDTIYVSYTDNSPSYTSTTWAGVDAWYFVISNVHCENISATSVDVCWTTNEGSNSKVYYGTNPTNLNQIVSVDTPYCIPHRVRLSGLSENTIYYYDVESRDFRGNVVRDNNNGQHYTFKTGSQTGVDILVLLCDGVNDATPTGQPLPNLRERFRKAIELGGWNYNYWETSDNYGYTPSREVMKNYKAVFSVYEDEYPPFIPAQQETIKRYEELGGRIAFASHDVLWHSWVNSSNKSYDTLWCKNYMQVRFKYDGTVTGTYNIYGVSGDPISGPYSSTPVSYTPHRDGAAYDSLDVVPTPPNGWDAGGTSNPVWRWNTATGGRIGARWESGNNHGTLGNGVWGGYKTRTIFNGFSITQMDTTKLPDILNNHFIWLIGHDHPDVTLTSPVGGNTYTTSPITISWTATAYGGAAIDTIWLEYSPDAGQTWYLIASGTNLTSPYSWNVSSLQNRNTYRVRITVCDKNVYPSMKGVAQTTNFAINIPGNDDLGPKVIPNSIVVANNPKFVTSTDTLLPFTAVISDSETGMSTIGAASYIAKSPTGNTTGEQPMQVSDGNWDEILEDVNASIRLMYIPGAINVCSLFVRGRDNATLRAQNWGAWYYRTFTLINGDILPVGIDEIRTKTPTAYALSNPLPNPARGSVRINYSIPYTSNVTLKICNCLGQVVRTLIDKEQEPGSYTMVWDGKDDKGRKLASGIYFYQFAAGEFKDIKKAVLLK